jgi:MFS superfamily sulfate permease-like transporter
LVDIGSLRHFWALNKTEFWISLIATMGVVRLGAIKAIVLVVVLSLLRFVQVVARPRTEILGAIPGIAGFHAIDRHDNAVTAPGLVMFRFNGPVVFFNADYFKREALKVADELGERLQWFAIDMVPITQLDVTGIDAFSALEEELARRGVQLVCTGRRAETALFFEARGLPPPVPPDRHYESLRKAWQAYCASKSIADPMPAVDVDAAGAT